MSDTDERIESLRPICPSCGSSASVLPLAFGLPSPEMFEAYERGEISLGGCCLPEGPLPHWRCAACGVDLVGV